MSAQPADPEVFHVGVTGTRYAVSYEQAQALQDVCRDIDESYVKVTLHHGCCVGADATAHWIAKRLHWRIHGHPGVDARGRSPWQMENMLMLMLDVREEPLLYSARNREIASWADILLACPQAPEDDRLSQRSGTWQTVRMARDQLIPVTIIMPDGSITTEEK